MEVDGVSYVALRKESVDRNLLFLLSLLCLSVALRKESVDRNTSPHSINSMTLMVALRKESVDRNRKKRKNNQQNKRVALRKESVDRNTLSIIILGLRQGRSPQGERG